APEPECAAKNLGRVLFDEDISLECQPGRKLVVRLAELVGHPVLGCGALHHVAVGVPRVAVSATEGAADVRVDRPESHARRLWAVEDAFGGGGVVADVL